MDHRRGGWQLAFAALGLALGGGACALGAEEPASSEDVGEAEQAAHQFCGGFGGFPCPQGFVCVDDPKDDCDPQQGGADCGGICRKAKKPHKKDCDDPNRIYVSTDPLQCQLVKFFCAEGTFFSDACGCGCEVHPGVPCGKNVCGAGEYCCNASCGICAPDGGFCTQQICGPDPVSTCGPLVCPPGTSGCNCACANAQCVPEGTFCAAVCL